MKHLVIGLGQVGAALRQVLDCDGYDPAQMRGEPASGYDVIHICFPYNDAFKAQVGKYQLDLKPQFTVIHSTVPIGTSSSLGAMHSPIRGKHPSLGGSILTFTKYIGGMGSGIMAREFKDHGIPARAVLKSQDCEAGKLIDLMQYAQAIKLNKKIHAFCEKNNLDFDLIYTQMNESYNVGYKAMGHPEFLRPVLDYVPGKIGGHCVVQNMQHLMMAEARDIIDFNATL